MRNAALVLPPEGLLYLYGPYRIAGVHRAIEQSFDRSLRERNGLGVRDLEDVVWKPIKTAFLYRADRSSQQPVDNFPEIRFFRLA